MLSFEDLKFPEDETVMRTLKSYTNVYVNDLKPFVDIFVRHYKTYYFSDEEEMKQYPIRHNTLIQQFQEFRVTGIIPEETLKFEPKYV